MPEIVSYKLADGTYSLSLEIDHSAVDHPLFGGKQSTLDVEGNSRGLELSLTYNYIGRYGDEKADYAEIILTREEEAELLLLLTLRAEQALTQTP